MASSAAPHPLRLRDFRFYWTARFASTVAQVAMIVVIGWQVYDIARHSMDVEKAALQLGFIGLVQFIPLFALTLVTGWVADRTCPPPDYGYGKRNALIGRNSL